MITSSVGHTTSTRSCIEIKQQESDDRPLNRPLHKETSFNWRTEILQKVIILYLEQINVGRFEL